ncbi:MAG TPA: PD-(D/E)XK nuclease family protein, partial [Pyrinomonadaceae bacterium]|nr:PD-(D/E)XK nuclease family protein [Pyrinomonadaceae bacterium]
MAKEIWLGPVLGTNRERLLARCAEYVAKGHADRLLYIAASHPLLDLVTEKLLDGKQAQGVWGEFPVYLFRGLVRRVLSSAIVSEARPRGPQPGSPAGVGRSGRATQPTEPLLTRGLLTPTETLRPRVAIDREDLPLRRSLISQIIKQLSTAGKLKAIRPLANRDGCVNTVATLIGELQRAGKTPDEFRKVVEERENETATEAPRNSEGTKGKSQRQEGDRASTSPRSQIDFDREVALIYSAYVDALDRFGLSDEDADQLRALQVLSGEVAGRTVSLPWLEQVDLLVLDGFFDFTPVQGEILRRLIPSIPNVIVNLNHDERNEEIFQPFQSTIQQLESVAAFDTKIDKEIATVQGYLASLRERLFNSSDLVSRDGLRAGRMPALPANGSITLLECGDRETEIRSIAKEIKSLVLNEGYQLGDVALVVRERSAYADTILRVCADESIPCNLERRVEAIHVPAVRACGKLFQLLKEPAREDFRNPKAGDIAHLLKTDYFRVSPENLAALTEDFDKKYASMLADSASKDSTESKLRIALGIGHWSPDILENVIAYVGSELRVDAWVGRAHLLIGALPSAEAARELIAGKEGAEEESASTEAEPPPDEAPLIEKRKKPVPVHPAAIAWTTIVLRHLQRLIADLPEEGEPEELRVAIASLLDRFDFANQVRKPFRRTAISPDIPRAALDIRGMEGVRRAMAAAVRSFKYAAEVVSEARASTSARGSAEPFTAPPQPGCPAGDPGVGLRPRITFATFVDEVERCLPSQVLSVGAANRDGLRVLEATDVRGLRFRAVFIAGMVEGGFPLRASRDWLYPHEERERLKKFGVVLEDISTDTLLKEEHYFYQAACRATDRLYLTRPLALGDGNESVASYYLEELGRAIAPAKVATRQIRGDVDTHDVMQASTAAELAVAMIRQDERHKHLTRSEHLLPRKEVEQLHAHARAQGVFSASALRRVDIERARNGAWFGPFDGEITSADLRAMLARQFGPEHVYSASALSVYGNCAYRFFANRVLRLEPRSEAALDLTALDAGKLLHDILRRFFEKHRREYLPSLDSDKLRRELADVADQVFDEHEDLVPPLNPRIWEIDREIRKLILDLVLLYELRLQERKDRRGMRPAYFELAFGRASQAADAASLPDYLKLERSGAGAAEAALVQGQIDRVDTNDDERVAVAYDYKLSFGAKLDDIESGRQVQIPIYLAALEQLFLKGFTLAGGGYYRLRGAGSRLNQGLYRAKFADCTSVTSSKTKLD